MTHEKLMRNSVDRDQGEYVDNYSNGKRNLYTIGQFIRYVYNNV